MAHPAAYTNDVETLRRLLDEDPRLIEAEGSSLLYSACDGGSVDAARLLLDRGAGMTYRGPRGCTCLLVACDRGHVEMVTLLLGRAADPTVRDDQGWTALMHAFGSARPDYDAVAVMRLLLEDGRVSVDARNNAGQTAFWPACFLWCSERARVLLLEGLADHTIADYEGTTPIEAPWDWPDEDCIQLLQWYGGELQRAFLLTKARAVVDANHSITKAPDKAQAKTKAEAQRAREEAAPAWLRGRAVRDEALPMLEVVGQAGGHDDDDERKKEEERSAVCEWLVNAVSEDLHLELMEGLRYRRWVPGENKEDDAWYIYREYKKDGDEEEDERDTEGGIAEGSC